MYPPSSPKGYRKRWREAAAGSTAVLASAAFSEKSSEQDLDAGTSGAGSIVETVDTSETDAKRLCSAFSDNGIASAFSVLRKPTIKMPWETGPLSPLFTGTFSFIQKTDLPSMPMVGIEDVATTNKKQSNEHAVESKPVLSLTNFVKRRISASKFAISDDDLRVRALGHFRKLICSDLKGTSVGISLLDRAGKLCDEEDFASTVSDCLAHKATGTLLKRASSMARFFSWIVQHKGASCFRPSEQDLYDYMQHLRRVGAGPTAAAHFEQAFRMCHEVLGMVHVDIKQVLSARVTGAAHSMFLTKRKLVQAPAFSVEAIRIFEDTCINSEQMHKRVIAGAILFCVFACARWLDSMHIDDIWKNSFATMVLLEADTEKHKTSMSKEAKTRLLPFVCLGRFFDSKAWGSAFIEAREHFGLTKPFLPSWNESSQTFGKHRMTTCESTCWIHELLEGSMDIREVLKYSSHSCKATLLTWAGMCSVGGQSLFSREERTLLGHHVEAQTRSRTTYSRDAQVMLQYKVSKLISMIKTGRLKPDASRAERLAMMIEADEGGSDEVPPEEHIEYQPSEDDSEDVASPCAELDLPEFGVPDDSDRGDFSLVTGADQWLVHAFTGVAHFQPDESDARLACGRAITVNLRVIDHTDLLASDSILCKQCESAHHRLIHSQFEVDTTLSDIVAVED